MELLEAIEKSTKETPKRGKVISWGKVAKLMGSGKPERWESQYRRMYGDRKTSESDQYNVARKQTGELMKQGITDKYIILSEQLKNERTIEELMYSLSASRLEVLGMIEELRLQGYDIIQARTGDKIAYTTNKMVAATYHEFKHYHDVKQVIRIGLVSDTHIGSNYFQRTYLQMAYDDFAKRGVSDVYHCGDISDGFYTTRAGSVYELYAFGFDQQTQAIVEDYPMRKGITTHFISGNHDATHIMNGGANIGKAIENQRPDMHYLGHEYAKIWLTDKVDMDLVHPRDGSSYAYSYKMQKRIDAMSGGQKPRILVTGHYHKNFGMFYRNIWSISMPSFQSQSPFMRGMGLVSDVGYVILELHINENGDIIQCSPLYCPFYVAIEEKF